MFMIAIIEIEQFCLFSEMQEKLVISIQANKKKNFQYLLLVMMLQLETDRYIAHRYAKSNFTMIRDARYYRPIFIFKYRFQKRDFGRSLVTAQFIMFCVYSQSYFIALILSGLKITRTAASKAHQNNRLKPMLWRRFEVAVLAPGIAYNVKILRKNILCRSRNNF